jgi:hypothetical protein
LKEETDVKLRQKNDQSNCIGGAIFQLNRLFHIKSVSRVGKNRVWKEKALRDHL